MYSDEIKVKKKELSKLYFEIHRSFPTYNPKLLQDRIYLNHFPQQGFSSVITHCILIQNNREAMFEEFRETMKKQLSEIFPSIRTYWKETQLFIYPEKESSGVYVTANDVEGYSTKFLELLIFIRNHFPKL
ncbi:MAG: hypothetical protein EOO46_23670 [Flavobacterium sp.]|nr:MAG: hypothetical protein EOO46_23670 [Flavobacterium sp.]